MAVLPFWLVCEPCRYAANAIFPQDWIQVLHNRGSHIIKFRFKTLPELDCTYFLRKTIHGEHSNIKVQHMKLKKLKEFQHLSSHEQFYLCCLHLTLACWAKQGFRLVWNSLTVTVANCHCLCQSPRTRLERPQSLSLRRVQPGLQ